ncbi:hypothetical protein KFK09_008240 [Dendrobium nobile]|uniref:Uncharacterized protein n=1 Tax=Dendrobium nobile TaxID=94219 RepID=A0A8T3BMK4_DENNO|nr:hypothetical protein KFK09_008238 [Dendrobium nobile]KAI0515575.1 hypothetical protein KFK09_008240 [Dendrobium nobile]
MLKKGDWKSVNRKPLGDISNGGRPSRDGKKKIQLDRDDDGGYFDRLILVRSTLSALVNQIDEILAQSSEQDMKSKTTNEEIDSLSNLLSEMHSSLKPWVLRLSQSQTISKTEVQVCKSLQRSHNSTHAERRNILPRIKDEETKLDMIISPSPLVAWRAGGCKLVTEKQLFLLTPLSRKEKLFHCSGSFKIKARNLCLKDDTSQTIIRNSDTVSATVEEFVGSKPCTVEENSTGKTRLKNQSEAYQKNKSNRRRDADEEALEWFLSPPKTCTLMDPNHRTNPSVIEDESLTGRNGNLPECFQESKKPDDHQIHELQLCNFSRKNDFDETLEWFLSPPKTCTLMDPLMEGKIPWTPGMADDSILKSRRAGENTLKKELWTKFQAVSMGRIFYKDSVLQKEGKKGFLDMLEEAT